MTVSEAFKVHSELRSSRGIARRPLIWLSCLCLDAPIVAVTWQGLFANAFHCQLVMVDRLALFLTAWWIYLADRLADSLAAPSSATLTARAGFCLRQRRAFFFILALVGLTDALVIVVTLDRPLIKAGLVLGGLALVYLFVNFRYDAVWQVLPIKELAVGFLFASGTAFVFINRVPSNLLFAAVFLFGCLCSLNCLSIAVWERELDVMRGKSSYATERPNGARAVVLWIVVVAILGCLLAARGFVPALTGSIATSATLLCSLHFIVLIRDERTSLADLVLLTPLVFLLVSGLQ